MRIGRSIKILAPLPGCVLTANALPRVSHKTLHPGLISKQPFGLRTPKACKYISPGYAFFAYPVETFPHENRTPKWVRGVFPFLGQSHEGEQANV
jgi:hypothetical protein